MRIVSNVSNYPSHMGHEVNGKRTCWWCADCSTGDEHGPHCGYEGTGHYVNEDAARRHCKCKDQTETTTKEVRKMTAPKKNTKTKLYTLTVDAPLPITGGDYVKVKEDLSSLVGNIEAPLFVYSSSEDKVEWNSDIQYAANRNQAWWQSVPSLLVAGKLDKATGIVTLDTPIDFDNLPAGPFDDTPDNHKAAKAAGRTITKLLEAILGMTEKRFIEAVNPFQYENPEETVVSVSIKLLDPKLDESFETKLADMRALHEAVKGIDFETRKNAFRYAAHYFNIRKGATWMR